MSRREPGGRRVLAAWLSSPPPDAAIEIAPEGVSVVVAGRRRQAAIDGYAVQPLASGAVTPALTTPNVADEAAVAAALRSACERIGARPRRVALVIPDLAARVSILRFDQVPARRDDLEQLIRWQMKKAAPFPIDEAVVTWSPMARVGTGREFLVSIARREVVLGYERACERAGMHAGLVDLATLSLVNLFIAGGSSPDGDWLVVHTRPEYTSMVIMRGEDVLFFRSRAEGGDEALADAVHQTAMYYQDRLEGRGFAHILLGGRGRSAGAVELVRRSLEERLGTVVEPIDPARTAALDDGAFGSPDVRSALAPVAGMLLRSRAEAAA